MKPPNDGGPAFPVEWKDFQPNTGQQVTREQYGGMTLRAYFAAKAMQGVLASEVNRALTPEIIAGWSVQCADALLKKLNEPISNPTAPA